MNHPYVHGYDAHESTRLQDQARTLVELLHSDTAFPDGSRVLEAGCGVGAQTVPLARNSPGARITSIDISAASIAQARARVEEAGLENVRFAQADVFALPFAPETFDHVFVCFVLEHLARAFHNLLTGAQATTGRPISIPTATRRAPRSAARSICSGRPAAMRSSAASSIPCCGRRASTTCGSRRAWCMRTRAGRSS